jgi:hypothetical protein
MKFLVRNKKLGLVLRRWFYNVVWFVHKHHNFRLHILDVLVQLYATTEYSGRLYLSVSVGKLHQERFVPFSWGADLVVDYDRCWDNCFYVQLQSQHYHWGVLDYVWHMRDRIERKRIVAERS